MSKPNFFQKPINNRWVIRRKLKEGGFGMVYQCRDIKNQKLEYAIKLNTLQTKRYSDIQEKMYQLIEKQKFTTGFVKYYENGQFMKHRYLLMELVGRDLDMLKSKAQKECFSIKTVLMIGLQVIDRLEVMHKLGYLHRDVKPDNLAIGLNEKNKIIYLFDFGLALKIGSGTPLEEKGKVIGTLGFMSCRAHEGKVLGPADDIEAMLYTLLYLAQGSLPWLKLKIQSPADFHRILLAKKTISKKHFKNQKIPSEIFELLATVQAMKPNEKIEYLKLKFKLLETLKRLKEENDFSFDWCGQNSRSNSLKKDRKHLSPEDTAREKKKLEYMRQQNQQIVQHDIYEVYKFMEKEDKQKNGNAPKKVSPPKKQVKKDTKPIKVRPVSAVPRSKPKQQEKPMTPWDRIAQFEKSHTGMVPKIVINKTAKHKI